MLNFPFLLRLAGLVRLVWLDLQLFSVAALAALAALAGLAGLAGMFVRASACPSLLHALRRQTLPFAWLPFSSLPSHSHPPPRALPLHAPRLQFLSFSPTLNHKLPRHIGSDTTAARPPRGGRRWCHCDAPTGGFGYSMSFLVSVGLPCGAVE